MNDDLMLAILSMDAYKQGYAQYCGRWAGHLSLAD